MLVSSSNAAENNAAENIGQLVLSLGALVALLVVVVSVAVWAATKGAQVAGLRKELELQRGAFKESLDEQKKDFGKRIDELEQRFSKSLSEVGEQIAQLDRWAIVTTNIINNQRERGDGVPQLRISEPSSFHKTRVKAHKRFDP